MDQFQLSIVPCEVLPSRFFRDFFLGPAETDLAAIAIPRCVWSFHRILQAAFRSHYQGLVPSGKLT